MAKYKNVGSHQEPIVLLRTESFGDNYGYVNEEGGNGTTQNTYDDVEAGKVLQSTNKTNDIPPDSSYVDIMSEIHNFYNGL